MEEESVHEYEQTTPDIRSSESEEIAHHSASKKTKLLTLQS